jgi:hypothetical protein
MNAARSQETDLWLKHRSHLSGLPFRDFSVPVECKNENANASSEEITRLGAKVISSGGTEGLFVARSGLAGPPPFGSAHHEIAMLLPQRVAIVVLTGADLVRLTCPDDLVDLVEDRYTELRTLGTYESI